MQGTSHPLPGHSYRVLLELSSSPEADANGSFTFTLNARFRWFTIGSRGPKWGRMLTIRTPKDVRTMRSKSEGRDLLMYRKQEIDQTLA